LSLVLSTSHFTPAQAIGGPIGNFNCNTGVLDDSVAEDDGNPSTYYVELIGSSYEISGGQGCTGSVIIAPGVTFIVNGAFWGNLLLTSVTIPNSVTSIGINAFAGSGLISVTIPNSVTTIGDSAFDGNTSLTSVTIGNSVTTIGEGAFAWTTSLTTVTIPESVITIGIAAFAHSGLTSVTIPDSVTTISSYTFFESFLLTSVTIGNSVTSIGDYAFETTGLTTVTIPDSVTTISSNAFTNTTLLTSVTIGNSVTFIALGTFGDIPAFTLTSSSETIAVNTAAIGFEIVNMSALADVFSITPTPPGMSFNTATGALTGTPSTAASATAYTVTATNGSFSASTIFTLTVTGPATAPAAPTLTSVTGGNKQLTIAFTPGDDGGAAITDYEYSLNGAPYISAGTTTSPFTITGLNGRTAYSVTIKARNSIGLSTASSSLSATTTDSSLDANEAAAAEAARVAAAAEAARITAANAAAKKQKELTELLSVIPSIAGLALNLGDLTNTLLLKQKCVKGTKTKYVKKGAKCPKGYVRKK